MKQHYFSLVVAVLLMTCAYSQTPFIHISADSVHSKQATFYGKALTDLHQKKFAENTSMINYNPAIPFNGTDDYVRFAKTISDLSQVTIFTVFQSEAGAAIEKEVWGIQGEESNLGLTTKRAFNTEKQSFYTDGDADKAVLHTYLQLYRTRGNQPQSKTFMNLGVVQKDSLNQYFQGRIAEVIGYKRRLRGKTRQKIETALALKYGITLQNEEDYLSSNKKVVWSVEDDKAFTYRVMGIGRDDEMNVYQKQSTSADAPELLVLSATQKAISNQANTSEFSNRTFIVLGDNNAPLTGKDIETVTATARQWMVKVTGSKSRELTTELQIDATKLFDRLYEANDYLLVVNPDASGDFSKDNTTYIKPSSLSEAGVLTFGDLTWDADKSDKDVFTIALKKPMEVSLSNENPEVCAGAKTEMNYKATGGIAPYTYTLKNGEVVVKEWNSSEDATLENTLKEIGKGNYTLVVKDKLGDEAEATYAITEQESITVELGENPTLKFEQTVSLTPQISNTALIDSYEWSSDTGFYSTTETAEVSEAGVYTLTVTTNSGCTYTDTVTVLPSYVRSFTLYPNPSPDGKYTVDVELAERADITVQVYNSVGILINSYAVKNKNQYSIRGKVIRTTGMYEVVLTTPKEKVTKKLIVQ